MGSKDFENLITRAREGGRDTLGNFLDQYRNYLEVLASTQIDKRLQRRAGRSDIVQETMLRAYAHFDQFRGTTEQELLAWLRQILVNNIATLVEKHLLAAKRDVRREAQLEQIGQSLDASAIKLEGLIKARVDSPSGQIRKKEDAVILSNRLAELSEAYREVLLLRNLRGLEFDKIAEIMHRSVPATRMLWLRALEKLRAMYAKDG